MSKSEEKAASYLPEYLIDNGYNVIPVNPKTSEILGKKSYGSVADVRGEVEIVDVFRRPEELLNVIGDAIKKKGIKVIWMRLGVYNEEAVKKARENGCDAVYNRCMME